MKTYYEKSLKFKELKLEKVKLKMRQSQSVVATDVAALALSLYIQYIYIVIYKFANRKSRAAGQKLSTTYDKAKGVGGVGFFIRG